MSVFEKKVENNLNFCLRYSMQKVRNREIAEEIAANVICLFCIKYKEIKEDIAWLKGALDNKIGDYFREKTKIKAQSQFIHDKYEMLDIHNNESLKNFLEMFEVVKKFLSDDELELLLNYYDKKIKIETLASQMNISSNALRIRVNNLTSEVKALYKIEKGYKHGNDIIVPLLKSKIIFFLRALGEALRYDDLSKLKNYLAELHHEQAKYLLSIKEIEGFYFSIRSKNKYTIIIAFVDINGQPAGLEIFFYLKGKTLRVTEVKDNFKNVITITELENLEDIELVEQLFSENVRTEDGRYKINESELVRIIDKYK